jgi:hypothetical protein
LASIGALLTKIIGLFLPLRLCCYIFATVAKKILILIVAMLYLTVSSGLAMNIHYCMGKISSVTFGHKKDHSDGTCGKCGMDKTENHCCSDETQFIKLTDSQQSTKLPELLQSVSLIAPVVFASMQIPVQGTTVEPYTDYFSPPPPTLNKVYLAVSVFRI